MDREQELCKLTGKFAMYGSATTWQDCAPTGNGAVDIICRLQDELPLRMLSCLMLLLNFENNAAHSRFKRTLLLYNKMLIKKNNYMVLTYS